MKNPEIKAILPDKIKSKMLAKGWRPTASRLAVECGLPRMRVHRIFSGANGHSSLSKAIKMATALQMPVEDFIHTATTLDNSLMGDLIKGRLARLGKSKTQFSKEISDGKYDGGCDCYTTGSVKYERLDGYDTIAKALDISLSELCEILLIRDAVKSTIANVTVIACNAKLSTL